ncbi:multiple inositol polyphosphate phosphatase 1-like isoform X1 [Styela clava]
MCGNFLVILFCLTTHVDAVINRHTNEKSQPYEYFNTKTLYDRVRGKLPNDHSEVPKGCNLVHIVLLSRHGSRYPGKEDYEIMKTFYDITAILNSTGNAELSFKYLQKLRNWKIWFDDTVDDETLAPTGYSEIHGITRRLAKAFPEILSKEKLDANKYRIISSNTTRTIQSSKAFLDGIFNTAKSRPNIEIDDMLLHSDQHCRKWIKSVRENLTVTVEAQKFLNSSYVSSIVEKVSKRLGIQQSHLSNELIQFLKKEGCAEQEWATGKPSPWCSVFEKPDLQVLEYYEDLENYFTKSFPHKVNYKQSCQLKNFILSALNNASSDSELLGHFLFGHSFTLMSTMTEMKLIQNDGPFTSANYLQKKNRKYRTSFYTPGSANVIFLLYECGEDKKKKLKIFMNEKFINMPLDKPAGELWDLDDALEYYRFKNQKNCQWRKICDKIDNTL